MTRSVPEFHKELLNYARPRWNGNWRDFERLVDQFAVDLSQKDMIQAVTKMDTEWRAYCDKYNFHG
jgi:hypothetical protein